MMNVTLSSLLFDTFSLYFLLLVISLSFFRHILIIFQSCINYSLSLPHYFFLCIYLCLSLSSSSISLYLSLTISISPYIFLSLALSPSLSLSLSISPSHILFQLLLFSLPHSVLLSFDPSPSLFNFHLSLFPPPSHFESLEGAWEPQDPALSYLRQGVSLHVNASLHIHFSVCLSLSLSHSLSLYLSFCLFLSLSLCLSFFSLHFNSINQNPTYWYLSHYITRTFCPILNINLIIRQQNIFFLIFNLPQFVQKSKYYTPQL